MVGYGLTARGGEGAGGRPCCPLAFDLTVPAGTATRDVLDVVAACGRILISSIAAAGPDARGWHWGPTDPGGFAAIAVDEILVHTYDITQGLAVDWLPPAPLCAAVL